MTGNFYWGPTSSCCAAVHSEGVQPSRDCYEESPRRRGEDGEPHRWLGPGWCPPPDGSAAPEPGTDAVHPGAQNACSEGGQARAVRQSRAMAPDGDAPPSGWRSIVTPSPLIATAMRRGAAARCSRRPPTSATISVSSGSVSTILQLPEIAALGSYRSRQCTIREGMLWTVLSCGARRLTDLS